MKLALPNFLFALLSLSALGCGLQLDAESDPSLNTCTGSSDCGPEGACVETQTGDTRCVATEAALGNILIEVRPSGGTASIVLFDEKAGDAVLDVTSDKNPNGLLKALDLEMPARVGVSGTVEAPADLPDECRAEDMSLPVDLTLIRRVEFGAFASRYEVPSTAMLDADQATSFATAVPPGHYDMYLQPHALDGCTSALPAPELVMDVTVEPDKDFDFSMAGMSTAAELYGSLTIPVNLDLEGWVLEVLDPTYGYVISNQFVLPAPEKDAVEVPIAGFSYHQTDGAVLRLRDLDGNLSVHWQLSAILLNAQGFVQLDLRDLVAVPTPFTASVIDSAGAPVKSAGVIVQSLVLTGGANQNASYRVDTQTDVDGKITVKLVEGTYAVTIIPDVPGEAAYYGEWVVVASGPGEEFGQGKAFELVVQPLLTGSVSDPSGVLLAGATIAVGPSQPAASDYFDRVVHPAPLSRQFSTTTLVDGSFQLPIDPGNVDVAVQMPAESGFAWSVVPSVQIDAADLKPQLDLGELQLRYPVIVQGHLRDGDSAVPYAQVRAWKRTESGALIQIGAAITDAEGGYVLPLPPGITIAETAPAQSDDSGQ